MQEKQISKNMLTKNILMEMVEKVRHDKRENPPFKRDKEGNELLVLDTDALKANAKRYEAYTLEQEVLRVMTRLFFPNGAVWSVSRSGKKV